jgi:hypothetical protein
MIFWMAGVLLLAFGGAAGGSSTNPLRADSYPWFDRESEELVPIWPSASDSASEAGGGSEVAPGSEGMASVFIEPLVITLLVLLLLAILGVVVWAWRNRDRTAKEPERGMAPVNRAKERTDLGYLSGGAVPLDHLGEARRCREAGDFSRSVVLLFVHQVGELERGGFVGLRPGMTARQIIRSIRYQELRTEMEPTLGRFERAFYGGVAITREECEDAWARAERVERLSRARHLAGGVR